MRCPSLIIFILLLYTYSNTFAQVDRAPFFENIRTDQLNLSASNLDIKEGDYGNIFIGNLEGLLIKNGNQLKTFRIGENNLVNKLYISTSNQVYFSSNKSFGYFYADTAGNIRYKYLKKVISSRIKRIEGFNSSVFFLSVDTLYAYNNGRRSLSITSSKGFQSIFTHNNHLFVKEFSSPLKYLSGGLLHKMRGLAFPPEELITTVEDYNDSLILNSFPSFQNYKIINSDSLIAIPDTLDFDLKNEIVSSIPFQRTYVEDQTLITTRKNGLYIFNKSGEYLNFNENKGLGSNIVSVLTQDNQNGTWVASQNGITRVEVSNKWSHWDTKNGLNDIILRIIKFQDRIYASTTNGIYFFQNNKWNKLPKINSRAFDFETLNSELLIIAPEQGLFSTVDSSVVRIPEVIGPWASENIDENRMLIASADIGLYIVSKNKRSLKGKLIYPNPLGVPYSITIKNKNTAWISLKWEGLALVKNFSKDLEILYFNEKHGLPKTSEIEVLKLKGKHLFGTSKGFYELNNSPRSDSSDLFIPSELISVNDPIIRAAIDNKNNIWYATIDKYQDRVLKKLILMPNGKYQEESKGLQRLPNQVINQIYPDPEQNGVLWVAGNKGLFRYDENIKLDISKSFQTVINEVSSNDSTIFHGFYSVPNEDGPPSLVADQPKAYIPILDYSSNNIKFKFSSNAYTLSEKNTFSYKLEGLENNWSNWTRSTQKEFSNLAPGTYTFKIRSKNLYGVEGKATFYKFIITPPWYLTTWAKIFFTILGLFIIWLVVMIYAYRLRQHRKHLKLLVADRTFEVMAQKKEIEKQYKQLSEQTEEILLQSEQIEIKNKELQESKEEVDLINTQLEEMNKHLERKVEKRTIKIKSTLEKLKETNKELDTFIYKASHDLKGPLSRIVGLTGLAKIETPTAKNTQYLELIERTSKDMDLLLSKLTQAHELFNQQAKIVPLLIEEILEEIKSNLSYLYSQEETDIQLENLVNEPIKADHQLFYTVLFNLIENSLIFKNPDTDKKHVIGIKIFREKNRVILKVSDNGIGIEEDLIYAVFNMFYRASDRSKGSGLGLYLVKIAIEKMKGEIDVESNYLEYTTFTVSLPQ